MGFWWFLFVMDLLVPVLMIISGRMMWKHCPKDINGIIGYRTTRSMKNMDTWKFAHDYCGRLWWKIGWIMLIPSVLAHILIYGESDNVVGTVGGILVMVQCVVLTGSIIPVEIALRKNFTKEVERK
ncbi:MAG: SdpI family protein [Lachnospiraceae bacterium]|nr:SdpI family protein [Lachnospiraceae bacterium]